MRARPIFVRPGPDRPRAAALAKRLGLPLMEDPSETLDALTLGWADGRLELSEANDRPGRGWWVDARRWGLAPGAGGLSRRQPLARALGRKRRHVVDATAGFGQDALRLAFWGHRVIAMERHPCVAALLEDGLSRAGDLIKRAARGGSLSIQVGDARQALMDLEPVPEVVYLDPMFPPKHKPSALAKKGVRLLRELVGDDPDAEELLAIARQVATRRVVVKRPTHAGPLGPGPDLREDGKLARYDVYLCS
ncbi:class I SAM-dependent methyltransferase [Myxococcota bacterium]|nr:class I SAM-dependent methyltransferase [Myxococcota bacterium]